jgi:hypothetical protein
MLPLQAAGAAGAADNAEESSFSLIDTIVAAIQGVFSVATNAFLDFISTFAIFMYLLSLPILPAGNEVASSNSEDDSDKEAGEENVEVATGAGANFKDDDNNASDDDQSGLRDEESDDDATVRAKSEDHEEHVDVTAVAEHLSTPMTGENRGAYYVLYNGGSSSPQAVDGDIAVTAGSDADDEASPVRIRRELSYDDGAAVADGDHHADIDSDSSEGEGYAMPADQGQAIYRGASSIVQGLKLVAKGIAASYTRFINDITSESNQLPQAATTGHETFDAHVGDGDLESFVGTGTHADDDGDLGLGNLFASEESSNHVLEEDDTTAGTTADAGIANDGTIAPPPTSQDSTPRPEGAGDSPTLSACQDPTSQESVSGDSLILPARNSTAAPSPAGIAGARSADGSDSNEVVDVGMGEPKISAPAAAEGGADGAATADANNNNASEAVSDEDAYDIFGSVANWFNPDTVPNENETATVGLSGGVFLPSGMEGHSS